MADHDEDLRTIVLPTMRRHAASLLRCVMVGDDLDTIRGIDWRAIADDLRAVLVVELIVGRPDDGRETLNRALDGRMWERHE